MTYDEALAGRVRSALAQEPGVTEKQIFGGLAFMVGGHMAVAAAGHDGLLLRCAPADTPSLVQSPGVGRFQMRGRALDGWLGIDPSAVAGEDGLRSWVDLALSYVRTLPPK